MLGYLSAKSVTTGSGYGKYETFSGNGYRKFGLSGIKCNGNESSLEQCPSYHIVTQSNRYGCGDHEYAGVDCNIN